MGATSSQEPVKAGIEALSEREKKTLRLLLQGHDAKSIAGVQGLSVHTVNERLRDARRKLGVSSSREAARRLAASEQDPKNFGDKQIGVANSGSELLWTATSDHRRVASSKRTWLFGGTLIMSLILAAALLSRALMPSHGTAVTAAAVAAASAESSHSPAVKSALSWVALVDSQQWNESWAQAGTLFRTHVTAEGWTAAVEPVRQQVGALVRRTFKSAEAHTSLPGAPDGEYEIVQFNSSFATAKSTVETVVLARESTGWKVVGYFVKSA